MFSIIKYHYDKSFGRVLVSCVGGWVRTLVESEQDLKIVYALSFAEHSAIEMKVRRDFKNNTWPVIISMS